MTKGRWEHLEHGADIGIRGYGGSLAEAIGCTFGQGFFWGRPVSAPGAMEAALREGENTASDVSERELD